jgi:hypothetical protein
MRYLERVYNLFLAFLNYQNNAEFNDSLRISQPRDECSTFFARSATWQVGAYGF